MRRAGILICILAAIPPGISAGEKQPQENYAQFSKLIHKVVIASLPKNIENDAAWGQTIPAPDNLRFPKLRTYVKVGDKLEVPHGTWRRFKGKFEDPDKDLKIVVKDFKKLDEKTYRIVVDADALLMCQAEVQQWQKGLMLLGATATADVNLKTRIVCDIGVSLHVSKFPPELNVEPKVTDLSLDLVDVKLRNAPGETANALNDELKELLRTLVKASEPVVKTYANLAIAQSLKEGKGTISADAIMKALPAPKK